MNKIPPPTIPGAVGSPTKRIQYFDMIKGVAIFMVLMGHSVLSINTPGDSFLFKAIAAIHMPLFFFISGWFSVKIVNGNIQSTNLKKRARQLLIPMLIISSLWTLLNPIVSSSFIQFSSFSELWYAPYKHGYWFTLVLFEIILIFKLIAPIMNRIKNILFEVLFIFFMWFLLMIVVPRFIPDSLSQIISYSLVSAHFPMFMIGVFCGRHKDLFFRLLDSDWVRTVAVVLFLLTLIHKTVTSSLFDLWYSYYIIQIIFYASMAIVVVSMFKRWSETAFAPERMHPGRLAQMWQYLGRYSLEIYFIHYWFLYPLSFLYEPLMSLNMAFVPMLVVTGVNSAILITVSLGVNCILSQSNFISHYIFGK
jgi:fucose 4-O-acetylase-like acetyltransferase